MRTGTVCTKCQDAFCLWLRRKDVFGIISSLSLVNAVYISKKYGYVDARERLADITEFVRVVDLYEDVAREALVCDWKDYEDAVQHMSAIKVKADCIVTRNKKDFRKSVIPVYTIDELMSLMARLTHSLLV